MELTINKMQKLLILIIILSGLSLKSQEVFPLIGEENYTDREVLVITNRLENSLTSENHPVFENLVDTSHSIKSFVVVYKDGEFSMKKTNISEYIKRKSKNNKNWLVFVHGDGKTFVHAALRGLDIQNYYNVNLIVFAWPSRLVGHYGGKQFKASLKNSTLSVKHYLELFDSLKTLRYDEHLFSATKLSIMHHSLGNRLPELCSDKIQKDFGDTIVFDNFIFNAAAVNEKNHRLWADKIRIQQRKINNSNLWDRNLNGLRIISSYKFLMGERLSKPLSDSILYFNFSNSVGGKWPPGRSHTYYLGITEKNQGIKRYYNEIFNGLMPDTTDASYIQKRKDGFGWDVGNSKN